MQPNDQDLTNILHANRYVHSLVILELCLQLSTTTNCIRFTVMPLLSSPRVSHRGNQAKSCTGPENPKAHHEHATSQPYDREQQTHRNCFHSKTVQSLSSPRMSSPAHGSPNRHFYTRTLSHKDTLTHRPFYTQTLLHRDISLLQIRLFSAIG